MYIKFIATNVSLGVFLSLGVFWHMYMQCTFNVLLDVHAMYIQCTLKVHDKINSRYMIMYMTFTYILILNVQSHITNRI